MFRLHSVVFKQSKLSAITVHLAETLHTLQPFSVFINKLAKIIILWLLILGFTMLIHNKDDIEFVTEFLCFLGHPVV